ncbi:MAG: GNAT family N-acetyltransferase [Deltaproteobacteria bacterium]|nr:GNAT family N-acetyltransferase [Deltaproteobacteria bacterium]
MPYSFSNDDLSGLKRHLNDPDQNLHWPSVFVLPDWMQAWWQVFGCETEMMVRTLRDGEKVVGIAPLMVKDGQASLIGDPEVCDYLDFIIVPGLEENFFHHLLDDLKKNDIGHLDLKHLRPESTVLTHLAGTAESRGYTVKISKEALSLEIDLPAGWEEYLASLSGKQRHEVRRKLRRLSERGEIEYCFISHPEEIPGAMDVFFRMFVESRQDKATFLTEKMKSFFISLACAMAETGLLKLGLLKMEERPLSEIMCFDYDGCIYLYNSGYDPDYTSLSAGLICKILAIKASIEQGKRRFDFLKGSELYKYQLGGQEVPLYHCQITLE